MKKTFQPETVKAEIRRAALMAGADVCGFGGVERFDGAPEGFHPKNLFPDCRSAVTIGIALPKGTLRVAPQFLYGRCNSVSLKKIDELLLLLAGFAEKKYGAVCVPVPCDTPYEYWDPDTLTGKGLLSMKHAAVACGLGQLGKSTLLLNPMFGNRLTLGTLLTDMELPSDPLCEKICLPDCGLCVKCCPVGAIGESGVSQTLCRPCAYSKTARGFDSVDCNHCRSVCPMRDGLSGRTEL